jgi:hypothetical protein
MRNPLWSDVNEPLHASIRVMNIDLGLDDAGPPHRELKINQVIGHKMGTERRLIGPFFADMQEIRIIRVGYKRVLFTSCLGPGRRRHRDNGGIQSCRAALGEFHRALDDNHRFNPGCTRAVALLLARACRSPA